MVITILEADVDPARESDLAAAFDEAGKGPFPPFVLRSFLARHPERRTAWRIMTVFRSRAELEAMRATGETPRAVQVFAAAGATPKFEFWEIESSFANPDATA